MTEQRDQRTEALGGGMDRRTLLATVGVGAVAASAVGAVPFVNGPIASAEEADAGSSSSNGAGGGNGRQGGPDNWYTSDKVSVEKVTFKNQYQMAIVGKLFKPKNLKSGKSNPAIVVGHPMGAVKEQSASLYATKLAEQGFVTLAIDRSFWGESEGQPRQAVLPDVYVEDFMASVDFLGTRDFVDRERIGALGICGSGCMVIAAAKLDPRIKAVATASMYDMGAFNRNGINHSQSLEARKTLLVQAAEDRYTEFTGGQTPWTGGTPHEINENSTDVEREFYDFYRTPRGEYTPESATPDSTTHRKLSAEIKFINFYPFDDIETISPRPMLFITGDQAHSREFSEDAYARGRAQGAALDSRGKPRGPLRPDRCHSLRQAHQLLYTEPQYVIASDLGRIVKVAARAGLYGYENGYERGARVNRWEQLGQP